jgi:hypothetical protein
VNVDVNNYGAVARSDMSSTEGRGAERRFVTRIVMRWAAPFRMAKAVLLLLLLLKTIVPYRKNVIVVSRVRPTSQRQCF